MPTPIPLLLAILELSDLLVAFPYLSVGLKFFLRDLDIDEILWLQSLPLGKA